MARNVYFSQAVQSEQHLYEDLIIESLKIFGQDVYYIPRTLINRDTILNEDSQSAFNDAYLIEAYIENTESFEGAGDLYSKFGLEVRDEINFVISRRVWNQRIGVNEESTKPREGDVLFLPMSNSFFEITFVEDDRPFYQLSNLPVYKLTCSLYEYNDEDFETGNNVIDNKVGEESHQLSLDLAVTAGNHFSRGEVVTQIVKAAAGGTPEINIYGEVQTIIKSSDTTATIGISNIGVNGSTEFTDFLVDASKPLIGETSNNSCTITKIYGIDDDPNNVMPADVSQNVDFENIGNNFIDFTESNPFGDPW